MEDTLLPDKPLHQRHKEPTQLLRPRELLLVAAPMRSNVNLSRIVRAAACCGVERIIACGKPRIDPKIARDGAERVKLELRRSLPPVIVSLRKESYQVVALEQTSCSRSLYDFRFERKTALVIGHERLGIDEESLGLIDVAVEIPVYGLPYSYNVATATSMALYEYCRQFPAG